MPRRSPKKQQQQSSSNSKHAISMAGSGMRVTVFASPNKKSIDNSETNQKSKGIMGLQFSPEFKPKPRQVANQRSSLSISIKNDMKQQPKYVGQPGRRRKSAPISNNAFPPPLFSTPAQPMYMEEPPAPVAYNNNPGPSFGGYQPINTVPFQAQPGFQNFTIDAYDFKADQPVVDDQPKIELDTATGGCCDIVISNIPKSVRMGDLVPIFSKFGTVLSAKTTRGGSLQLTYETSSAARKALEYNGAAMKGSPLTVQLFSPTKSTKTTTTTTAHMDQTSIPNLVKHTRVAPDMDTVLAGLNRRL